MGGSQAHGGLNDGYQGTRPEVFNDAGGDLGVQFAGSTPSATQDIGFLTISTTGNQQSFGNLSQTSSQGAAVGSKTRGAQAIGLNPSVVNSIEYIEFATKGNGADFGDLTVARRVLGGKNNNTRGVFFGGKDPSFKNTIDYITISTLGNAADFGDALTAYQGGTSGLNSNTRGLRAGGINNIDFITIASTGDATDYGDLISVKMDFGSTGNGHGGLVGG
jgi:hypothetical protein